MPQHPCYIPNGRVIIFNFPAGAGGKMLQNCVSISRHCVFTQLTFARWQIEYRGKFDNQYYNQKLQFALSTLPPKEEMRYWLSYELGENKLYDANFVQFQKYVPITSKIVHDLAAAKLWSTITVHNHESSLYYHSYWPTVLRVSLINNENFARKSLSLKLDATQYDTDWNVLGKTPPGLAFEFSIDDTIYDKDKFLSQVSKLYDYLEFEDFQSDLIEQYYSQYIQLHI